MSGDYKVTFLTIKNDYETRCVTDTMSDSNALEAQLSRVDAANNFSYSEWSASSVYPKDAIVLYNGKNYKATDLVPENRGPYGGYLTGALGNKIYWEEYKDNSLIQGAIQRDFAPIAQYYANLQSIKERLQDLLDETSKEISSGQGVLMNEERYSHSIHPERAIKAREATNGFIPELKTQTIPILISIGAAMLAFSIVLSFQMMGVYGQFTLSPAYSQAYATFQATVASIMNNTSVVGGFAGVSLLIALYFAYLFYSSQPRD